MKLSQQAGRRGQPLMALVLVLAGWAAARSVLWTAPDQPLARVVKYAPQVAQVAQVAQVTPLPKPGMILPEVSAEDKRKLQRITPRSVLLLRPPETIVPLDPSIIYTTPTEAMFAPFVAAGHQKLFLIGTTAFPGSKREFAVASSALLPGVRSRPNSVSIERHEMPRWSALGWVLWRQGGNGYNLPGRGLPGAILYSEAYGASQAGMVVRYSLARHSDHRPGLYLRASSGIDRPRGEELAAGGALRPVPKVPLAVMGELRATRTIDATAIRPSVAVVTELSPWSLPLQLRGEVYAQAGWVGGKVQTAFIDGQARIDRHAVNLGAAGLRIGVGAWGGAQRGTSRLDIGPSLRIDLPVAGGNTRLSADYRIRVAGSAAPGNGLALTFSAGF